MAAEDPVDKVMRVLASEDDLLIDLWMVVEKARAKANVEELTGSQHREILTRVANTYAIRGQYTKSPV